MKSLAERFIRKYSIARTIVSGYVFVIVLSAVIAVVAIMLIGQIQSSNRILYRKIVTSMLFNAEITNQLYEMQLQFKGYLNGDKDLLLIFSSIDSIEALLERQKATLEELNTDSVRLIIDKLNDSKSLIREYRHLIKKLENTKVKYRQATLENIYYLDSRLLNLVSDAYMAMAEMGKHLSETVDRASVYSKFTLAFIAGLGLSGGIVIVVIVSALVRSNEQQQKRFIQEERIRLETEKILAETQLKVLQAQINPHFLFNTLNVVARTSFLEGAVESERLTYALANILRYSLRHVGELVSLADELKCIRDYFDIHQVRFGDGVKLLIDVDEEALLFKLPILTLQPLIENSIVHGLEPKNMTGEISVKAYVGEDGFYLDVVDNGVGMSPETIEAVYKNVSPVGSGRSHITGLGLGNVIQRIRYSYPEKACVKISSELGSYTTVSIKIEMDNIKREDSSGGEYV